MAKKRRVLTKEEKLWAKNVKRIWADKRKNSNLTQERLADICGFKTQSAITQYLNGVIALNYSAKLKFAKALKVPVTSIDPDFPLAGNNSLDDDAEAAYVFKMFLELNPQARAMILQSMETLIKLQNKG